MPATASTLTIDLATKKVTVSGSLAIREKVTVTLVNLGESTASNLSLRLLNGAETMAFCLTFTASGDTAVGTMDLSATALIAIFDADEDRPDAKRQLHITVWDKGVRKCLVHHQVDISNCVYTTTMTAPTPL